MYIHSFGIDVTSLFTVIILRPAVPCHPEFVIRYSTTTTAMSGPGTEFSKHILLGGCVFSELSVISDKQTKWDVQRIFFTWGGGNAQKFSYRPTYFRILPGLVGNFPWATGK